MKRAVLLTVSPVVAFSLAEGGLRLCGYGSPTAFLIPAKPPGQLISNSRFAWQFYSSSTALRPFLFTLASRKAPGTIRVCVLGESAAMGTPDPAFGFGRILEIAMRRNFPERRFEVINAAMRGINSHIIRLIAKECARHEVDYFVVYMGNNEVVGFHAPDPDSPRWSQSLTFIRVIRWLGSCRLGQWLDGVESRLCPSIEEDKPQDMAFFRKHRLRADDWRREAIAGNFRANLEDTCRAATSHGAKVILGTVAVNLGDCPPLGSLHRSDLTTAEQGQWERAFEVGIQREADGRFPEAIEAYESAAKIDDHFAELQFRLGRCYSRAGEAARARARYESARDWDATQFRADSAINRGIRDLAARWEGRGVVLADVERAFSESPLSDAGVPGGRLFNDHVHPTFAGAYVLARTVYERLAPILEQSLGCRARGGIPTYEDCLQTVPYTSYDDLSVASAMARLTARPPFLDQLDHAARQRAAETAIQARQEVFTTQHAETCLGTYRTVVSLEPDYWPARFNLAWLCQESQRYQEAIEHLQYLTRAFPGHPPFSVQLAAALAKSGDQRRALLELRQAVKMNPTDKTLKHALRRWSVSPGCQ